MTELQRSRLSLLVDRWLTELESETVLKPDYTADDTTINYSGRRVDLVHAIATVVAMLQTTVALLPMLRPTSK